ncbi:anti-sigma factor domain-containing protein [Rufibacter sp. LB8]|uniref:anti-sigma factor n=1 Tax=Rufibacter sp. LB8 TaxID=2777781 RepID=UPI00178C7C20|nr:anti-sigma factor [Rufibacter sp. LB8]
MNTQEYIDSGVLELYVAGGLSEAESAEVEQMAGQHPAVKEALAQAQQAMEAYALTHAQVPRPELEDIILNKIASLQQPAAEIPGATNPEARVVPMRAPGQSSPFSSFKVAAAVALLVSIATNIYLYSSWRDSQDELLVAQASTRQYALQASQLEVQNVQTENLLAIVRDPQTRIVQLKSVATGTQAQGTVFWNNDTKEVFFDASRLPAAPAGKQYQLWALADGKPIDAGVVGMVSKPLHKMKIIDQAQAFAVTLEPTGGSQNPTLAAMQVMGSI